MTDPQKNLEIGLFSRRFAFHHAKGFEQDHLDQPVQEPEKMKNRPKGVPVDLELAKLNPRAKEVLEHPEVWESQMYDEHKYHPTAPVHPDKLPKWKHLSFKSQMEYRRIPKERREAYLRQHSAEIASNHAMSVEAWKRKSADQRVAIARPSLIEQPELMVEGKKILVLGGKSSRQIAEGFRGAQVDYVGGNTPKDCLAALKNYSGNVDFATLNFDPTLFWSQTPINSLIADTEALLKELQNRGAKVSFSIPMKPWNVGKGFQGEVAEHGGPVMATSFATKNQQMVRRRHSEYRKALGQFKESGLVTSLVDLGNAAIAPNTYGTNEALLDQSGDKFLSKHGQSLAVNSAILGINMAAGYDGGSFTNERYWPGGEDYNLGTTTIDGKPVERVVAGAQLLPEDERKAAYERVMPKDPLDKLRRVATELMGPGLLNLSHQELYTGYLGSEHVIPDFGAYAFSNDHMKGFDRPQKIMPDMAIYSNPAKQVVHETFFAIQKERAEGKDVSKLTEDFAQLASLVYVKLARMAIVYARELFEDPNPIYLPHRRAAFDHAQKYVQNAQNADKFYGFHTQHVSRLANEWEDFKKLPEVAGWKG
ncbi:hypothetical protein KC725_03590 [Candidatus Peregrinibacteria bacterium]|nr:hypothetical protein [Candidatus Peregrinibacteria bacterium]